MRLKDRLGHRNFPDSAIIRKRDSSHRFFFVILFFLNFKVFGISVMKIYYIVSLKKKTSGNFPYYKFSTVWFLNLSLIYRYILYRIIIKNYSNRLSFHRGGAWYRALVFDRGMKIFSFLVQNFSTINRKALVRVYFSFLFLTPNHLPEMKNYKKFIYLNLHNFIVLLYLFTYLIWILNSYKTYQLLSFLETL